MKLHQIAAQTWDIVESVEQSAIRIHDGATTEAELKERADYYLDYFLFGSFPQAIPQAGASIMEIGSGLGYIMEAVERYLSRLDAKPSRIVALDIAQNMLDKARGRLSDRPPYIFQHYDGVHIPLEDGSFDLIYSVACLQHIPRPYVFNLFFEIRRLLKPGGHAILHFLSTDALPRQEALIPWRAEITNQIQGKVEHWHHFYTTQELEAVLRITGFPYVSVRDYHEGTLIACVSNKPLSLPPDFDPDVYLDIHEDVKRDGTDPIEHYLTRGHNEGRVWYRGVRRPSFEFPQDRLRDRLSALWIEVSQLRELTVSKQVAKDRIDELRSEHAEMKRERDQLQAENEALKSSTSWRLTLPVRLLMRALRGH